MGLTEVKVAVSNPANPERRVSLKFFLDSGMAYAVAPKTILKRLGIKPHSKQTFVLANGEFIERDQSNAFFEYKGQLGASPVIFGEPGDSNLLGVVTLEALGFVLDPLRRELKPMPMLLM